MLLLKRSPIGVIYQAQIVETGHIVNLFQLIFNARLRLSIIHQIRGNDKSLTQESILAIQVYVK